MPQSSVHNVPIKKVSVVTISDADDVLATEEPLEIRLQYGPEEHKVQKSISVTMRTPGNDAELATGFLYTEGIIHSQQDIISVAHQDFDKNIIEVKLNDGIVPNTDKLDRNFYTTSSCGVCGKSSIDAIRIACHIETSADELKIPSGLIYKLPALLRQQQDIFEHTGGLHASALFDLDGQLLLTREDVGRHNALDKLIGASLKQGMIPLDKHILLLSGRASFELIQKATMAGIKVVAAVGAPSSLAVQLAKESGMTLLGFLRGERFNIYSGEQRIIIQ